MQSFPPRLRAALAVVLALLAAFVVVVTVSDDPTNPGHTRTTITVQLSPIAKASPTVPDQLRVPAPAIAQVARSSADDHDGARNETPLGVPAPVLEAGREQQDRLAARDQLPIGVPAAAPVQAGCRSRFISTYSSRRGVAPRLFVLHFTVSPNTLGWSDVDGVTGFFARPATAASSNYVNDGEGHCNYIVREVDKAWTQAGFNPVSVSVEQINSGRERVYAAPAGLRQLARIARDSTRRWKIPLRRGIVSGCSVVRSGVIAHQSLGACGGGHVDIAPYSVDQVIAAARALDAPKVQPVTSTDRRTCARLNAWRAARRPASGSTTNVRRRQALERRHVTCTARGAVRTT